jgi:periplasmic protein TonB
VSGRLIVWGVVSLAIHAGAAGAGFAMLRGAMPPALVIDLVHGLMVIDEPAASPGGRPAAGAPSTPPSARPSRSGSARAERRVGVTPPPAEPTPRAAPAETPPATPMGPEPAPAVVESPPAPVPPPTAVTPPPMVTSPPPVEVESAAPRLAGPPSEPPADGPERASGMASPSGGSGGAPAPPAGPGTSSTGRGSSGDSAEAGAGGRDGAAAARALALPGGTGRGDTTEYDAYYALVRRRIVETLTYPPAARRRSLTGTVQLELEVQPTGGISRVAVVASSSHRVLDDAAVETVRALGRVPFPPNLRPRVLIMRLPIVFELR